MTFPLVMAWLLGALPALGQSNALPSLSPPYGELPPTFWEQHVAAIVITAIIAVALAALGAWLICRPRQVVVIPPEVRARSALENLRGQPEDGAVLSRISQVIRDYFIAAFGLAPGAWTTTEFCREMSGCKDISPDLAAVAAEFLRDCDGRKFSATTDDPKADAANRALSLIDQAEQWRARLNQSAGPQNPGGHE